MFARAFGIFCCFCLYCRCYCCCCWCCYFTTAASARCYFPSNSLAKTIWWMLYRTLRKVPGMDTNNMSKYTWWPQHVLLLSFLLWLVLQRENMTRLLFLAILDALLSRVCPNRCLWSTHGRRSWRFTGTQLLYTCDSLCRRRTMITRQKNSMGHQQCALRVTSRIASNIGAHKQV